MRFPRARALLFGVFAALLASAAAPPVARASNDPLFDQQWGLTRVGAPAAWTAASGAGIRIGVVDSGVDRSHPDLAGKVVAAATCVNTNGNAANCSEGPGAGDDIEGHGTHVSGIAAAVTNNDVGVAGVAPDAQIVEARVFYNDSNGNTTANVPDLQAGINWVVAHGAKVVNLSLGVDGSTVPVLQSGQSPIYDAVESAWNAGALPVIAAGNNGQDNSTIFGGQSNYGRMDAIVVAATGRNDELATYSSAPGSAKWGMAAPGGNPTSSADSAQMIVSTYNQNRYAYLAGTSMAAPFVSGAAALLLSKGYSRSDVVNLLLQSADHSVTCGAGCNGRLDIAKALGVPASAGTPTTVAGASPTTRPRASTPTTRAAAVPSPTTPPTEPVSVPLNEATEVPTTTVASLPPPVILATPAARRASTAVPRVLAGAAALAWAGAAAGTWRYKRRNTLTTLP